MKFILIVYFAMEKSRGKFEGRIRAHFWRTAPKTGLSAPSPRICQCKSCGLSAAIQDAWASSKIATQFCDQPLARAPAADRVFDMKTRDQL
jgi:hypothetical protein